MKKWVTLLAFVVLSANADAGQRFLTLEDAAVAQAKKWQQTGQAKPIISDDGRIMYPFGQYLPKLTCTLMRVCDIQLEPGELVTGKPVAGDTARWMMSKQASGTGDKAITHVIVKPTDVNIRTNLIITTDRRTYQIELFSSPNERDYLNMIGFYYPEDLTSEWDESAKLKAREQKARDQLVAADLPVGSADRLDFDYSIDGGSDAAFKPVRVYNDGLKTYIQLPDGVPMAEAPVLLLIDKDNKPAIVNWRPKTPTLYEVDKLFDKAMLVVGTNGDEQKITITWNKHKRSFWSRVGGN
ncbi:P-type conjugative transfer protein TrbG [Paraburkholderia sp. Se-20369]|nr:P-type conjugative transfer protein TrbG [Paraburkholderia sp. Se-20369]